MRNPRIALIQMNVSACKQQNIIHAQELIEKACQDDVDIIILPEMFNCPYQTANFPIFAEQQGGECFLKMKEMAKKHNIYLFAGSIPEKDEQGNIYNTAYVFDRLGELIGRHRKIHLFDISVKSGQCFKESETLTAGNDITIVETEFGKIGVCVCYDFRFPELSRIMADKNSVAIIVPGAFNMTTGPAHWELLFRGRAADNQLFTIGVAPARDEKSSYISYANSIVCSPWGEVLARLGETEEILYITLNLEDIGNIRSQLPLMYQRRKDVYKIEEL